MTFVCLSGCILFHAACHVLVFDDLVLNFMTSHWSEIKSCMKLAAQNRKCSTCVYHSTLDSCMVQSNNILNVTKVKAKLEIQNVTHEIYH